MGRRTFLPFIGASLAALVCATAPVRPAAGAQASATPTVRVSIVRAKESTSAHLILLVQVQGTGMVLGSYEGRLQFDPALLAIDSAVAGRDGSRFVNARDALHGFIRFAGFTPTGFASTDAVRIVGRMLGPVERAHFIATLVVAGDLEGSTVPKQGLIGATTIGGVQ